MSLSKAQVSRYWREWQAVCRVQGWKSSDNERRYALHAAAGSHSKELPQSMRGFGNRHFDKYLAHCAGLQNKVDIRDRDRERADVVIERLGAALSEITGGPAYVRAILGDMHDAGETYDLPLDPIPDQRAEGRVARIEETKRGPSPVYRADLDNHKITLKNRLSKFLTRIKKGDVPCPAGREWWTGSSNNDVIAAIIDASICIRVVGPGGRTAPHFVTPAEYARLQRERTASAPASPAIPPPPKAPFVPITAANAWADHDLGPDDDSNIPF